jgi:hypothetical protein
MLPPSGNTIGDARVTEDTGTIWVWTGSAWIAPVEGATVWGTIGGTLSDQLDLQSALNAKQNDNLIFTVSSPVTLGSVANTDYVYLVSGNTTVTLPAAASNGNLYTVKNVGAGTVVVNTTGGATIDGSVSASMPVRYTSLDFVSDGTNWNII